jgi:hypothetical protein
MSGGEMVIQEVRWPDGSLRGLRLLRADERIKVSAELLEAVMAGEANRFVSLVDGVFRVDAMDGAVSYRVTDYEIDARVYVADRIAVAAVPVVGGEDKQQ